MLQDKVLIWQFNHGRPQVLHEIYDKYKTDLLTMATVLLSDLRAAEDVVHDVFVSLLKSSGRVRLTGSLKGYLMTCVLNAVRNIKRAQRRHPSVGLDQVAPIATEDDRPDRAAMLDEELTRLKQALAEVPYPQREALILRVYGQMKFREIAKRQGISTHAALYRYRNAIDRLGSMLDGEARR
jgi:RNA polymerase sigma-70 factor (ECF subfamily)